MLTKGGSNWVDGDRFFDRKAELEALEERVRDGTHTLLTAQRRMGKTSLVRELLQRLADTGEFETVFVDLEAAMDPADAVAEIGLTTPQGRRSADEFLSWLRRNGQTHRGRITMILSGSVGLEPLLEQAGLSAHANIYSAYDLKPWSEETAASCLAALAESYDIGLSPEIREDMCRRLRCCIPHHVQMFFDKLHDRLRRAGRQDASPEDAERVYLHEMLSVRGQVDMQHYEGRLETILGRTGYPIALEILTETAVRGRLEDDTIDRYRAAFCGRYRGWRPFGRGCAACSGT